MTEFMGFDGYTLTVPVMFGDGVSSASIEPELEVLRGLARNLVGQRVEPAVVEIEGPAVPLTWLKYVINDIKFNTEYRNDDGSRYYAQVDITFFEWRPTALSLTKTNSSATQLLVSASSSNTPTSTSTSVVTSGGVSNGTPQVTYTMPLSGGTYTVRKGDTLQTIAKATLGNANLWKSIAVLNSALPPFAAGPIRDPKSIQIGQVLRMPKGATVTVAGSPADQAISQIISQSYGTMSLP
jgi:LysM repeat protein